MGGLERPKEKFRADTAEMLHHTLAMLRIVYFSSGIPKIQSLARLRAMHSEVSEKYLIRGPPKNGVLPPPPFRGTKDIVPILSADDLREEGRLQKNCVATYAGRVRKQTTFIFRVLKPERATLSIVKGNDGVWTIGELESHGNKAASEAARLVVAHWLEEQTLRVDFSD